MTKDQIREEILNLRKNQDISSKKKSELEIYNSVINWEYFKKAKNIGIYFATKHELDTNYIIKEILEKQKNCYLPVISNKENIFDFYLYNQNIKLMPNKFDILEPEAKNENKIDINSLDMIFVPIVGFNENKERIGMGKGFYDRALANLSSNGNKTILVGLAFDFQKNDRIKAENFDIPLDFIITESKKY